MLELNNTEIKVVVLVQVRCRTSRGGYEVAILTPTTDTSVSTLFKNGTMCLPFVTELSRLGLKASPEKSVMSLASLTYWGS